MINRTHIITVPDHNAQLPPEPQDAPILVEIGFGNGDFLVHLAQKRTDAIIYGIEVSLTCVEKAISRANRLGLKNVRIISGDARFYLRECFQDNQIERIYMSFPCPWPKEKHAKRRVTAQGFSDTIASVLKPDGTFELATDEGWYADEVAEILGAHKALKLADRKLNFRREITTKYERKWLDMKKDIHHLYFQKDGQCSVQRLVEKGDHQMHVKTDPITLTTETLKETLQNASGKTNEESNWVLRDIYTNGKDSWLVQAICSDASFEQKFYIKIVTRDDCALVKLDGVHIPYLTPSVRDALHQTANLLNTLKN